MATRITATCRFPNLIYALVLSGLPKIKYEFCQMNAHNMAVPCPIALMVTITMFSAHYCPFFTEGHHMHGPLLEVDSSNFCSQDHGALQLN